MGEFLLSVGIDLGTTTTQVVFSKLEVENVASAYSVPRIKIIDKKIIYRGDIYFTPLLDRSTIDIAKVRGMIESEYAKANIAPKDVSAGAVIITGETARKENSEAAIKTLNGLAGDFVVATAGSDLESILAGRGAGTAEMSKDFFDLPLVNLDIGGGTTNIGVFKNGSPVDTGCLDIGGRQIIIDKETLAIKYIAEKTNVLAQRMGLSIREGEKAKLNVIEEICGRFAQILAESLGLSPATSDLELFTTAHPLKNQWQFAGLTYSGGVADFVYKDGDMKNPFPYGDIGAVLGWKIQECRALSQVKRLIPKETIRATVVGAGSNAVEISGSTIAWTDASILPVQNVPIVKMTTDDEADNYKDFARHIEEKISWYKDEQGNYQLLALSFAGVHNPSFEKVKNIAGKIIKGLGSYLKSGHVIIIVIDNDMAKSLGYSLMNALPQHKFIVLDSIKVDAGDYIDIGAPVAAGRVIPVVIKTLIFGK